MPLQMWDIAHSPKYIINTNILKEDVNFIPKMTHTDQFSKSTNSMLQLYMWFLNFRVKTFLFKIEKMLIVL